MERARELIQPYLAMPGLVGGYVVGSATRPYRDRTSDYDIELVVEDEAYAALPIAERHVFTIDEGPPRRVDHEFYFRPWSEYAGLESSTRDVFHFAYGHAVVLHDPSGRIAEVAARLAAMSDAVRDDRVRVHYAELAFACGRIRKTLGRGADVDVQLLAGEALRALAKLLFVAHGSWVPSLHWASRELALLGVPDALVAEARSALHTPTADGLDALLASVGGWLSDRGETFHQDLDALASWAFCTDAGKRAFDAWSAQ